MKRLLLFSLLLSTAAQAAVTQNGDTVMLSGANFQMRFQARTGALESVAQNGAIVFRGGEFGLWQLRLKDGTVISAKDCTATVTPDTARNALTLSFKGDAADVTVRVSGNANGADWRGTVNAKRDTVLDFYLPARLRFAPENVRRFVFPMSGQTGTGWALRGNFFGKQTGASGWQPQVAGPQGYAQLFGGALNQLGDNPAPVPLQSTATGREWLGDALAQKINGHQLMVNRASKPEQTDLILVNSANGPWLAACKLGGANNQNGALWRIANSRTAEDANLALDAIAAVTEKLSKTAPPARLKIGLIALQNGPVQGAWSAMKIADLQSRLQRAHGAKLVVLQTPQQVRAARQGSDFLTLINPYGEHLPADDAEKLSDVVAEIGAYVKAGGNWWELGGYPFYAALRPLRYYSYSVPYPPAFADFAQLEAIAGAGGGTAAIFGVQPQSLTPWIGAQDKSKIFVPGRLSTGGDENGGYFERNFGTFVPAGQTWTSPIVRFVMGGTPETNLRAYAVANNFTRTLQQKVKPDVLAKMRGAVLVKLDGYAREKAANLHKLPAGSIVHFSDYLKGGFDKEYPDHLPPHPNFGTPEEFKTFLQKCRELGHLSMPYTNPTWWCDHPRGPTFQQYGEEPLLKELNGKAAYEKYGNPGNDGWTITHWHPAVQAANRKTVEQFSKEYPVDIQFQDQLGARAWKYDTNPASPTPYAYYDGLISQGLEDSLKVPIGTEDGHDRVINIESQLCGLAWGVVPFEHAPEWRRLLTEQYAPSTWELYPMAQILAHDKTAFYFHDLGAFVTNREVLAYALGLGFNMSSRINASQLDQDAPREWLKWLDRLQKSVGAAKFGKELTYFNLFPTRNSATGQVFSRYGDLRIYANLTNTQTVPSKLGPQLEPYGFYAAQPYLLARGDDSASYVITSDGKVELWAYASPEHSLTIQFPEDPRGKWRNYPKSIQFDGQKPQAIQWKVATPQTTVRIPALPNKNRVMAPADLANKAPKDWGNKPAIAVLNFEVNPNASWTKIAPTDWQNALRNSRLAKEFNAPIKSIKTPEELYEALQKGPRQTVAIINPYPELIFAKTPGAWRDGLGAIRDYVNNGGQWIETGGASFYHEVSFANGQWTRREVGGAGSAFFGVPVGGGEIQEANDTLKVPARAQAWLGAELTKQIEAGGTMVNRGLPRGNADPGHFTLVAGTQTDFLGGYRLNGWGWLWRTGGFYPAPEITVPAIMKALEYLYANPPQPVESSGTSYLWHAVLQ